MYTLLIWSTVTSMSVYRYKSHKNARWNMPSQQRRHIIYKGLMLSVVKMGYTSVKCLDGSQPAHHMQEKIKNNKKKRKLFLLHLKGIIIYKCWRDRDVQSFWGSISIALLAWLQIAGHPRGGMKPQEVWFPPVDAAPTGAFLEDSSPATRLCKSPASLAGQKTSGSYWHLCRCELWLFLFLCTRC